MVHLVVMTQGKADELNQTERFFAEHNRGWWRIEKGVWVLGSSMSAADWRDFLSARLPNTKFIVSQLTGTWASHGIQKEVVDWLKSRNDWH